MLPILIRNNIHVRGMLKAEHVSFYKIYNKTFSIPVFTRYMYVMAKSPLSKHELVRVLTSPTVVVYRTVMPSVSL